MGVASFTFDFCRSGCRYDACVECSLKFAHFVDGCSMDKLRIKCMICRQALRSDDVEDALHRMLYRRKKFYMVLRDIITDDRIVMAKDGPELLLSKVTSYVNRHRVLVNLEPATTPQVFIPPPAPSRQAGMDFLATQLQLLAGTPIYVPSTPAYTSRNQ
jgi:hypothetical protein